MKQRRLKLTIIGPVIISAILVLVFAIIFVISARAGAANIQEGLDDVSLPVMNTTSKLLFNPLYNLDVTKMNSVLDPYVDGTSIVYAAVYDINGAQIVEINKKWAPDIALSGELSNQALNQSEIVKREVDDYLILTKSIAAGTTQIGTVEIVFDQAPFRASLGKAQATISITLAIALIATVLLFFTLFQLTLRPLNRLAQVAQKIGEGELSIPVSVEGTHEVASLALSLEWMRAGLLAEHNKLQDVLSGLEQRVRERTAIAEAARAESESARKDIEAQVWLATGQTQLADAMRGEQDISQLAENVISQICQYTDVQAGALFLLNEKILTLAGRYAFAERPGFSGKFQLGEGLVGQAAADGKVIYLQDIPSDTLIISTGLVDVKPRQIVAAPFYMNGKVVGVLELATLSAFTQNHLELWNRISESLGAAFNTAQTRQRLADLLEESQQQSEELQAQEEELRAANEELHAQAERMKIK